MDLVDIEGYEGLYSFDKTTNQIFGHTSKKYLKPYNNKTTKYTNIYLWKNNKPKTYLLHRLIYKYNNLDIDITNLIIDHKDGNTFNNNLDNLRIANKSENRCNSKINKDNKLGEKNIKWNKYSYLVRIKKNGITCHRSFKNLQEAIEWRDLKRNELHGEFANYG